MEKWFQQSSLASFRRQSLPCHRQLINRIVRAREADTNKKVRPKLSVQTIPHSLLVQIMPLHAEVLAEGNTLKEHSIKRTLKSQLLPASPFSYNQFFPASFCSQQNKLLADLFTDFSLSRKPRVPCTFKS